MHPGFCDYCFPSRIISQKEKCGQLRSRLHVFYKHTIYLLSTDTSLDTLLSVSMKSPLSHPTECSSPNDPRRTGCLKPLTALRPSKIAKVYSFFPNSSLPFAPALTQTLTLLAWHLNSAHPSSPMVTSPWYHPRMSVHFSPACSCRNHKNTSEATQKIMESKCVPVRPPCA